jgi:uncharacterized membrane protein YfcA
MSEIFAYLTSGIIGISLGLIGAGGSILTVPVLVYIAGVNPVLATAYSLFVVGSTALVGGLRYAYQRLVNWRMVFLFGIPSIGAVYATRAFIMPAIPDPVYSAGSHVISKSLMLLLLFSLLMIAASYSMIRNNQIPETAEAGQKPRHYGFIMAEGIGTGILTGLVGAGGGFLIIPALVLLARIPMKLAIGTSLMIIALKSLIGFIGDVQNDAGMQWGFLIIFTLFSIAGIFAGAQIGKKIEGKKLQKAFGWFVLIMGVYIIIKETLLNGH